MSKDIVIVCSGEDYAADKIKSYCKNADAVIACDGGFDILQKCGVCPDLLIGDMDSIRAGDIPEGKMRVIRYPREKDFTDSELAIAEAKKYNPDNIYLFAATGSFVDHSLVNVISVVRNAPLVKIVTSDSVILYKDAPFEIASGKSRRFSIFPITDVTDMRFVGAKYHFSTSDIKAWEYSLGNEFVGDTVTVTFSSGKMLVIVFD